MSMLGSVFNPVGPLQRFAARAPFGQVYQRMHDDLERRPVMPLVALGFLAAGVMLLVALTISAGALSDNFGGADELSARTFRPWFRIALLAAMGVLLTGIITMLLAISVRIWWVAHFNRTMIPVIVDARPHAAGRAPRYVVRTSEKDGGD